MNEFVGAQDWIVDLIGQVTKYDFDAEVKKQRDKMEQLNIVVIGKTGVGKSTLINAVFGDDLATTGVGRPVTEHCERYSLGSSPISIYDSKGIETGTGSESMKGLLDVLDVVKKSNSSPNTRDYIHICWYCILEESKRIEGNEVEIIKELCAEIPVIVVITQSMGGELTNALRGEIQTLLGDVDTIPVMALPKEHKSEFGETKIVSHGVDKLVNKSYELLPSSVQKTFAAYQKTSIELKVSQAYKASLVFAGAVAASSFQPLPIADSPIMIAIQVTMMARITALFGVDSSMFEFKTIVSGLGGPFVAALVGRTLTSLLKAIPGVGTAAGGLINATTGAALTLGIAKIYIEVLSSIVRNNGMFDEATIMAEMEKATEKINLNDLKKEWKENKEKSSKEEILAIVEEAKKDL